MLSTAQKFAIFLLFTIYFLLFTIAPAMAQDPYSIPSTNSDVPQNLHTFTQSAIIEVMSALACQITGLDPTNPQQKCLGLDAKTGKIGYVENGGGLLGLMTQGIAMLYTPPIHTSEYLSYLSNNFGVTKPAYAQSVGAGFTSLSPFLGLWTTFRNITYLLFIIVFVVIGVMIMLRIKIDQKAVMGVENQIPKIIIGIILVTFSFAIAGLLIDFMYVIIYLAISIISPKDIATISLDSNSFGFVNSLYKPTNPSTPTIGTGNNLGFWTLVITPTLTIASAITNGLNAPTAGIVSGSLGATAATVTAVLVPIFAWPLAIIYVPLMAGKALCFFNIASGHVCDVANGDAFVVGLLGGVIAFLVVAFALLWALFRLWFTLLNAYIFILIDVITAPFWIIAGIAPGSTFNFSAWIRDLMANLMAFPTAIILFLIGKRLMEDMGAVPGSAQFTPPLIGAPAAPATLAPFVGLGIVLLAPTAVQMMRDIFKAPPFKYTAAIGQAVGVGAGVPQRLASNTLGLIFSPYYDKNKSSLAYPHGNLGRVLRVLGLVK